MGARRSSSARPSSASRTSVHRAPASHGAPSFLSSVAVCCAVRERDGSCWPLVIASLARTRAPRTRSHRLCPFFDARIFPARSCKTSLAWPSTYLRRRAAVSELAWLDRRPVLSRRRRARCARPLARCSPALHRRAQRSSLYAARGVCPCSARFIAPSHPLVPLGSHPLVTLNSFISDRRLLLLRWVGQEVHARCGHGLLGTLGSVERRLLERRRATP